ncbi:MAG: peptidase domain-containing ABC transporter, partial [Bacilli bacterium]|nr:peptidase domain-containing ABC transporter [Bacilli bacterium]
YPFVKQDGIKDCGVASLLMIIKYYKGSVGIEQLRDMTKTTKKGTTAYHLVDTALQLGMDAKGVKCKLEDLNKDNIVLPAIAHITIDETYNHYIVIYEVNFKKKTIIIADPGDKIKKITFSEFEKIWNNIIIFLYPIYKLPTYKNKISLLNFIANIVKKCRNEFKNILLLSVFLTAFSIFTSLFFKYIIDGITYNNSKEYLFFIFIVFLIVHILKIVTDFFRNKILIYLNQKIDILLTTETFKQIILLPYNYYCNRTTGEIVSRINDLSTVREMISKVAYTLLIDLPLTTVSFILLIFISPKLFAVAVIILMLYIINIIIFKPLFNKYINNIQIKKAQVTSFMVESISGFETIKGINIENKIINKFENKYFKLLTNLKKFDEAYNNQYVFKEIINNIGFIVIIYLGSLLVIKGEITLGQLLTFNALLTYFLGPIRNVIDLDSGIKEANNALKRTLDLFYDQKDNGIIKELDHGDININDLSYSYNDRDYILKNINLTINNGEKVLIIGSSGSGKSTLLKILMKYYNIKRGQIKVNNIDINDYCYNNYKKEISYISQKEVLFTDTLENNLKIYNNHEQTILQVAKMCEVDEIIKNNNVGYKMIIEENGNNISGGEKQRIVLARALLKPFKFLIIDEGLNQMDINLERRILKRIINKYHNKTIIVVTHRLENMDLFDKVAELKDGKLAKVVCKNA